MPDDFREVGPTLSISKAKLYWKTGDSAVLRWHQEAGTKPASPVVILTADDIPAWFKANPFLPLRVLASEHGVLKDKAARWRRILGVDMTAARRPPRPVAPSRQPGGRSRGGWGTKAPTAVRDDSAAGVAADSLRRLGYLPVCRARTHDPKAPADQWIVGRRSLSSDEMMRLAAERARPHPFTTSTGTKA